MKFMNVAKKFIPGAVGTALMGATTMALADAEELITAATGHITTVEDTSWTLGGVIVGAVAVLVCIGIVIALMRKA